MSAEAGEPKLDEAETTVSLGSSDSGRISAVFAAGTVLDNRYKILEKLGSGGMGTVFKAQHLIFNDVVALKVASNSLDEVGAQRFQREAVTSKLLDHEYIVKVSDFGLVDGDTPFFVMQYVEGKSLSEIIKQNDRLKPDYALEIFSQVCSALAHAHDKGVVHRDLKPSNIIVDEKDGALTTKVLDFGIAKLLSADSQGQGLTRTGDVFGSPLYMSPEQCLGANVDQRSDIYSFGCSLFEALCGTPPFTGESALHTMMLHQSAPPPTLKEASLGLVEQPRLEQFIAKLLAKDPQERYQSFDEVKLDLSLVRGGKDLIVANTAAKQAVEVIRKNRDLMPWLVALVSLSIAVLSTSIWFSNQNVQIPKEEFKENSEFLDSQARKSVTPFTTTFTGRDGKKWKRFEFPAGKNLGVLMFNNGTQRVVQNATGIVEVPAQALLTLTAREDSVRTPKLLHGFGKNDLYGFVAKKFYVEADDKFVIDVVHLTGLQALCLDSGDVTDIAMGIISNNLPNLDTLSIGWTPITGPAVARYPGLTQLRILKVPGMEKARAIVPALRGSQTMEELVVNGCKFEDSDMESINTLSHLKRLQLRDCSKITDAGIAQLKDLKELQFLDVNNCNLTPACISSLSKFPNLRTLFIALKTWSQTDRDRLQSALPRNCAVSNSRPNPADEMGSD